MKTEKELLIFEQHLYLRQPGYRTGKYLLEKTLADWKRQRGAAGKPAPLRDFFDTLHDRQHPIALGRWEMTGIADGVPGLAEED